LYFAAEATPYDLENLRTHVHDLRATAGTRLELRIDRPSSDAAYRRVSTFLRELEAEGVQTSFTLSPLVPGAGSGDVPEFPALSRRRP
jgi:hypothetical protein